MRKISEWLAKWGIIHFGKHDFIHIATTDIVDIVEQYSQQHAIAFAEWKDENCTKTDLHYGATLFMCKGQDGLYDNPSLYTIFLNQLNDK